MDSLDAFGGRVTLLGNGWRGIGVSATVAGAVKRLRAKAQAALGPKFDIKGFHDLLIASGSQPLPILERRVDDWIAAKKAG